MATLTHQSNVKGQQKESIAASSLHWYLLLALGMICFGSGTPVSKLVGTDFPVFFAAGIRLLLAGIVLLPFALWKDKHLFGNFKGSLWKVLGIAVIGNIGFTGFLIYGMQMVNGVMGSIIMALSPAIVATGSVLFLQENMTIRKWLALLLGISGVVVMQLFSDQQGESGNGRLLGSVMVFIAICCEATYTLLGKKTTEQLSPLSLSALSALLAGIILLPITFWQWSAVEWQVINVTEWLALLWWSCGTLALGSVLWYSGVRKVPGHIAAGFMVLMPISALLLSYVLLGESFQWIHMAGFGLAIGSVFMMTYEHQTKHKG